jgi:hypothetical protein
LPISKSISISGAEQIQTPSQRADVMERAPDAFEDPKRLRVRQLQKRALETWATAFGRRIQRRRLARRSQQ